MDWVFTYTDCAGNTADWTYTYTIDIPAFTVPVNVTSSVVCIADVVVPSAPVVTDACGNTLTAVMTQNANPICVGDKIFTFTYTDCAGNVAVHTNTISINDNVAPTASNIPSINVAGSMDVPAPNINDVFDEADNCTANPVVAWVSDVSDGNVCNFEKITRTYSVTDDCGNQTLVTQEITILAVPAPIDAGPDQVICEGESTLLSADNPWGANISWNNGIMDGVTFTPNSTMTYTVTANNLGCISTDDVTVSIETLPVVSLFADVVSGCEPLTVNFTNTTPGGMVDCFWEFSDGSTATGCGTVSNTFENAGLYDVTLTTSSALGCTNTITYTDYIYVEGTPIAQFTSSDVNLTNLFTEVDFTNNSIGATYYDWSFGDGSYNTSVENPTHVFPSDVGGSYVVQLVATTPLGCADTAYQVINIKEELIYWVPNTFTPDGDSYNEYFKPIFTSGYDPYDYNLLIFNRWGEIVWESNDANYGWDGTYNNEIVQDGTYTWKIEFKTSESDERKVIKGHVNVLR